MSGPLIQNFSVPAGDAIDVNFDVDPDAELETLLGTTPYWVVYEQVFGVPTGDPIIKKVLDNGLQITDPELLKFTAALSYNDTVDLLGNYYHEAFVIDGNDDHVSVTVGTMCVTNTKTRDFTVEEIP